MDKVLLLLSTGIAVLIIYFMVLTAPGCLEHRRFILAGAMQLGDACVRYEP